MLPFLKPLCRLDVCNELATNFSIQDARKIFRKCQSLRVRLLYMFAKFGFNFAFTCRECLLRPPKMNITSRPGSMKMTDLKLIQRTKLKTQDYAYSIKQNPSNSLDTKKTQRKSVTPIVLHLQ